jgi:DNA-binding NarL/FixJ family response regulator
VEPSEVRVSPAWQACASVKGRLETAPPRVQSAPMKMLLVSSDPAVREMMKLAVGGVRRAAGPRGPIEFLEAADGKQGIARAWRHMPEIVVADEIASRAGAFALARDLKSAQAPFPGKVIILLDRSQDAWLAAWSGADAWFVKPVNPFDLADTVAAFLSEGRKEAV